MLAGLLVDLALVLAVLAQRDGLRALLGHDHPAPPDRAVVAQRQAALDAAEERSR